MDNTNKHSAIIWLPAKEGVGKNDKPYKLYNGSVTLKDGTTFDISGFESESKDGKTKYIKLYERDPKPMETTETTKKEF